MAPLLDAETNLIACSLLYSIHSPSTMNLKPARYWPTITDYVSMDGGVHHDQTEICHNTKYSTTVQACTYRTTVVLDKGVLLSYCTRYTDYCIVLTVNCECSAVAAFTQIP